MNKPNEKKQFELIKKLTNSYSKKLYFHQQSRISEVNILYDYKSGKLQNTLCNHLDNICSLIKNYNELHEKIWIVSRCIKAIAHSNFLKELLSHSDFKKLILDLYLKNNGKVNCIADLILQFSIHAIFNKEENKHILPPPKKLQNIHYNEENSRIAIESATAYLYAENKVKSVLDVNLYSFAKKTGNNWLYSFINLK